MDDDEGSIRKIRALTEQYFFRKNLEIRIHSYDSAKTLLFDLPDLSSCGLYLLDVEMPEVSGLEVAGRIRREYPEPCIIYITNYIKYAPAAFEVNAFRYIPKQMLEEKLPLALDALCSRQIDSMDRCYRIQSHSNMESIYYREIYYLHKDGKYVSIVHENGIGKVRKTLQEVYQELDSEEFIYIDKSCVVNLKHVMSLKQRQITMRNRAVLPISAPRVSEVKKKITDFWEKHGGWTK